MSQAGILNTSSGGGGTVITLTGNTGGAVPATAGNINVLGSGQLTVTGVPGTSTLTISQGGNNIVTQTGSNTFALSDANTFQLCTSGSAMTLTVPTNASVAFPISTQIDVYQQGAGQVSIAAAGGVTIHSVGSNLKLVAQYSGASLKKTATDTWELVGGLTA